MGEATEAAIQPNMAPSARPSNNGLDMEEDESDYGIQKTDRKVRGLSGLDALGSDALVAPVSVCTSFQKEIQMDSSALHPQLLVCVTE